MVNVVLFPGNIKLNHTFRVPGVVYRNGWVWFPRQLVKTVLNFPVSLRELRTVGGKKPGKNKNGVATLGYNPLLRLLYVFPIITLMFFHTPFTTSDY